jgi:DNA-binding LytR/AlgR family response regulator
MIKVLIVDDEPLAQDILETHIARFPDLELLKKCNNAIEAGQVLEDQSVDLLFLDIQMPRISGVDFFKSLANPPLVIFTTAYSNYAVEGFELNAVDFLLKPISFERFSTAVTKAREKMHTPKNSVSETADVDHIYVKSDKKLIRVRYSDIIYIEGLKDYVIIRMDTGRIITLQTMKSLEEKLPSHIFKRVHRSYIVSIQRIHSIEGNSIEVIEKGVSKHLPIGKNYRDELLELIDRNKL